MIRNIIYYPVKVVFVLEDGSEIVDVHEGKETLWDKEDVDSLLANVKRFGRPAFTYDLLHYDVNYAALHERFPEARILEVVDIYTKNRQGRPSKK